MLRDAANRLAEIAAALQWDRGRWIWLLALAGGLASSLGLWWLSPGVRWYVGASGVLHSVMAAGVVKHFAERSWDRWLLGVGLCAKLAWEQWAGSKAPLIVVDAHLYGALCGFIVGAALSSRIAIIRYRSRG